MLNPAANDGLYKKVLGHDLEIVLLTNPADIKAGDDIKAEVLLNGKPVKAPLGPVSYTHLDVYKRQSSETSLATSPKSSPALMRLAISSILAFALA